MSTALNVGDIVDVRHCRFGRATVKVLAIDDIWIHVEIVKGRLVGMRSEWRVGDEKTVRAEHCAFYSANRKGIDI